MANEWNKALSGLTSGLASIGNAVIDKNAIDRADTDFKAARDKIAKTYSELLDSNNQILEQARNHLGLNKQPPPVVPVTMPDGSVNNFEAGSVDGSAPPVQPIYKDPKQYYQDLMNAYVEGKRVLDNNPMGSANSKALDLYYSMIPKNEKPSLKFHFGPNGEIIQYTEDGTGFNVVRQPNEKEVKQKFGMPEGSFMKKDENGELSWYGIKQGTDGQVEEYKLGIKPTEQDIFNYNQSLTEPEKSGRIGRRGFSGKIPTQDISGADAYTQALLKKFAVLKSESNNNWDEFYFGKDKFGNIDKEKVSEKGREWDAIVRQLKTSLPGVDIDKLANDVFQGTFNKKTKKYDENALIQEERAKGKTYTDLLAWKNNIGNMWGRYSLDPNDANNNALLWLNEMDKHGWFSNPDVNIDSLRKFFKETTGRNLDDYVTIK